MQDKTINNALLGLRKQIIRGHGDGLEHVVALLALRGVDMPEVRPAKRPDVSRKGLMRRLISDSLRDGPKTMRELSSHVDASRPEIDYAAAYHRTGQALAKMKLKGLVRRDGRLWSLV